MKTWWTARFELAAELEERLAGWLDSSGALGAEIEPAGPGRLRVTAWFSRPEGMATLSAAAQADGTAPIDACVAPVADEGWAERYQQSLIPFEVGERFVVVPSTAAVESGGASRIPLHVPPGRAFGTGDHPTTALCLAYLERRVRGGMHMVDVGTGSGILAIAAVKLGASRVVAVEPDREAAAVALRNLRRNGVSRRVELVAGTTADVRGSWFDLLAANILSGTLLEIMPELALLLRPGGQGVLSGLMEEEWPEVADAAAGRGLEAVDVQVSDGWAALEVRKPTLAPSG